MTVVTKMLIVVLSGSSSAVVFWFIADRLGVRGASLLAAFVLGLGVQLVVATALFGVR